MCETVLEIRDKIVAQCGEYSRGSRHIVLCPFSHEILTLENNCRMQLSAICTYGDEGCDILAVCTALFMLGLGHSGAHNTLCPVVRRWASSLVHSIQIFWPNPRFHNKLFH